MSTQKRNIRQVMDAGRDKYGVEQDDSSNNLYWTGQVVNYYGAGAHYGAMISYDQVCKDSNGDYPHLDPVLVIPGFGAFEYTTGPMLTNTGLKHIHHQMQAQRGFTNMGTFFNSSSPSQNAITGTGNGNGTYKASNISMGDMRGHEYATTSNGLWPSTLGGTVENLRNTGEISVGSTS